MARPPAIETETAIWLALNVQSVGLTDDQFFALCSDNDDEFVLEMSAQGELIIMSPSFPETDEKNSKIIQRLANWAEQDGTGVCFGSNAGFTLPNGARRSPDAAWIPKSRWHVIPREKRRKFHRICPDFVIELRSLSNRISKLQEKIEEYVGNGARLGWLLYPLDNCATIYRSGQAPERIDNPTIISGDPVLPGFKFDFREIL